MGFKELKALFTHEDPQNLHKTLGFLSLLHYMYRIGSFFAGVPDLGFDASYLTLVTLLMHLALSLSSLVFNVPPRRIKDGSRIWPEYRLHSIIFAARSCLFCIFAWAQKRFNVPECLLLNAAIVIGTMALADSATAYYKDHHSNTIRHMDAPRYVKFLFSCFQIYSTVACLNGTTLLAAQFMMMFAIQITAFMMTLRRKNVVGHYSWVAMYMVILVTSFHIAKPVEDVTDVIGLIPTLSAVGITLRLKLGVNKYLLWTAMAVALWFIKKLPHEHFHALPTIGNCLLGITILGGSLHADLSGNVTVESPSTPEQESPTSANSPKPEEASSVSATQSRIAGIGNLRKLFTKHDRFSVFGMVIPHAHKTLGIGCLLHFVCRFRYAGERDMLFDGSMATLFCLLWHTSLSLSSVIFHIPGRRVSNGSMIWPEYRVHSIVFALRSVMCMLSAWFEHRYDANMPMLGKHFRFVNVGIVFLTLYLAEHGAAMVAPSGTKLNSGSGTIRDLSAPVQMRTFFSYMQFHATGNCLLGSNKFSLQFMYVWIIQFTAFILTLRRKNVVPHLPMLIVYGIMLILGFGVYMHEIYHGSGDWSLFLATQSYINICASLRMGLGLDKYIVWTIGALLLMVFSLAPPIPVRHLVAIWVSTLIAQAGVMSMKCRKAEKAA